MTPKLWLEPAGYLRGGDEAGNWRMSAYRVRGLPESEHVLIAEDGATGRWGIVRGLTMQWSGDFETIEAALLSLQEQLGDEGSFE